MKKKFSSMWRVAIALVMVLSLNLVTAVPAPVMAEEEGTNYAPFGTVLYIWGTDQGELANVMKWFYIGGDGASWNGHKITIVNSQCPEFNGQWYLKNTASERFTLWADYDEGTGVFSDQVTTTETGLIGDWEDNAAYAIDGWVDFDPLVDTVGDPRETVGNYSYMWYNHSSGFGWNLEVKISNPVEHGFYGGWYLELVENGWTDLNGGWYLKWLGADGAADRYELYYDAGFTQLGIPENPAMFVAMGGTEGYLYANSGRFVLPDYLTAPVDEAASAYADDGGTGETETTNASIIADAAAGQSASVNLAEYTGTPIEGESVFGAVGSYIDVYTATPENLDEVEIRVNYSGITEGEELSLRMSYWDVGVGDWRQASDQGVDIGEDFIWAKIRWNTTPDLSYLAGGPFGAGSASVELDSEWYRTDETVNVTIEDALESGLIAAFAWSDTVHEAGKITFALLETDTGIFEGSFDLVDTTPGAGELLVNDGDQITVAYLGVGYTAIVDDTASVITIVSPTEDAIITGATPEIKATYSDDASGIDTGTVVMTVDGTDVTADATVTTSSVTYTPSTALDEGSHAVTVAVSDVAGNDAVPASWSFTVDTVNPVITTQQATPPVVMPGEENTVVFTANVVDATSGIVSVTIDLSEITEGTLDMLDDGELPDVEEGDGIYSAEITTTLSEGNYELLINAADAAGLAATAIIPLAVSSDIVPPVIGSPQITYPIGAVSARVGDPFVVSAVVTDNGVLETVTLSATSDIFNIGDGATATVEMTAEGSDLYQTPSDLVVTDGIDADSYELTITATDDKGNTATDTLTLVVTTKLTGYNIALAEDWNLMSLPLIPDTPAIGTILASISENVDIIWGYDPVNSPADPWAMYVPGVIEDDLTQMVDGMGYWVYMTGSATLTISGIETPEPPTVPPTYEVASGWNLMGVKDVALEGIAYYDEYLASIAEDYSVIWGYDPETGYFNIHPLDSDEVLSPGQGYWLWMDVDGIIVPPR